MARWGEVKAQIRFMKRKGTLPADDEPCVFKLPRRDARKRIEEKASVGARLSFPDGCSCAEFNLHRERIMRMPGIDENPTRFGQFVTEILATVSEEFVARWQGAHEGHAGEQP